MIKLNYVTLKEAPPWDLYIQLPDDMKEIVKKKWPSLLKYYNGFEDLHPITRELLERARKSKSLKLTLGFIEHCFACGKHKGPATIKRPDGSTRILFHHIKTFPGYRNKRFGESQGAGFFCQSCAPERIEELQREAQKRNVHLKIVNKCNSIQNIAKKKQSK